MSKMMDDLNKAQGENGSKYTVALQKKEEPVTESTAVPASAPLTPLEKVLAVEPMPAQQPNISSVPQTQRASVEPVRVEQNIARSADIKTEESPVLTSRAVPPPMPSVHVPRFNFVGVYALMSAVLFTGVMSLYLSFNAVIGFKDNKAALENLTSIATEQNKKVKGVQISLSDLVTKQEQKISAMEQVLQDMSHSVDKNDARLSSLMSEASTLRSTIEDLKNVNRDLKIKYSDLSTTYFDLAKEIDDFKKVSVAATGSQAQ